MPVARFWASLVAFLLIAAPLGAQEESVHLQYDAQAGCPGRSAFIAEVTARTARARFVEQTSGVRTFQITIRTEADRSIGTLTSDTGQAGSERRVSGKTCSEVVSALALIAALAIDPSASTRPESPVTAAPAGAPNASASAASSANAAPSPESTPIPAEKTTEPSSTASWGLAIVASGEGSYGFTSDGSLPMWGGSADLETGPFMRERKGPLLRLGARIAQSSTIRPDSPQPLGEATLQLIAGRASISPITIRIASTLDLHPWVSAERWQLKGSGAPVAGGLIITTYDNALSGWAIGEGAEARWTVGNAFWLALDLRIIEPLFSGQFQFHLTPQSPPSPITSVPFLQGILGLSLGGRIL